MFKVNNKDTRMAALASSVSSVSIVFIVSRASIVNSGWVDYYTFFLKRFTARKVSKYRVFSGPYFPVFGLNTEISRECLRTQFEYKETLSRITCYRKLPKVFCEERCNTS